MKLFLKTGLTGKIALIITGLVVAAVTSTATLNYLEAKVILQENIETKLDVISTKKAAALEKFLVEIEEDIKLGAINPSVKNALSEFEDGWNQISGDKTLYAQTQYITNNPHPTGRKEELDFASDPTPYNAVHKKYHPYFRSLMENGGYYDVFLFDAQGDLIYSVFKEADYATNFINGRYAQTDLGRAYRAAMNAGVGSINFFDFAPYSPSNDAPASFVSTAVAGPTGDIAGVLAFQMPVGRLNAVVGDNTGLGESGQSYIIGPDNLMRSDSRHSKGSTILSQEIPSGFAKDVFLTQTGMLNKTDYRGINVLAAYKTVTRPGLRWAVVTQEDRAEIFAPSKKLRNQAIITLAAFIAIMGLVGAFVGRQIAKPIIDVTASMRSVSGGDRDSEIPYVKRTDEIGAMAASLKVFRDKLAENELARAHQAQEIEKNSKSQSTVVNHLKSGLHSLSEGNLVCNLDEAFDPEYDQLRTDFNNTTDTLKSTMHGIISTSNNIQSGAVELSQASDDLSKRTESQAAALEETAAALDEVTVTVQQTAKAAKDAHLAVSSAKKDAIDGGNIVTETVAAMGSIKESSEKISQIITVIDEISFQTNLLALNAGVEAARAGEAGRGFAVVASEVRALAQRSSDAAKDIKELINASAGHVQTGVTLVDHTGEALDKIMSQVSNLDTLVSEIAASANEQASGLVEVNSAINEMDRVTQRNAAMVEESTAACHALTTESDSLISMVGHFKIDDAGYASASSNIVNLETRDMPKQPLHPVHAQQNAAKSFFQSSTGGAAQAEAFEDANDWQEF